MKVSILLLLLLSTQSFAKDWIKLKIPGAKCGDGVDYSVFYSPGDSTKLFTEFMGGGACWSLSTCFGPNLRTWMHPIPEIPTFSVLTSDKEELSPFTNHSSLYFPYCTGDVHSGDHSIDYKFSVTAHHRGYSNVQKTIRYLKERNLIQFSQLKELILSGSSAGGIGALVHAKTFEPELGSETKKIIISDSPGLHFGRTFWEKFTTPMISDFQAAFSKVSLDLDFTDGMVAQKTEEVCRYLSDWKIGFLQGSQDLVMSRVFGNISPSDHRDNVYSPRGIYETSKKTENCAAFTPDTKMHTFLILEKSSQIKAGDITALDFVKRIYAGKTDSSFK